MITEIIRDHLIGQPDIDAVYSDVLPQDVKLPALVLQVFNTEHEYDLQGAAGCVLVQMRIDAYAWFRDVADQLHESARQSLQGFSGDMGGNRIDSIQLAGWSQTVTSPRDGSDRWMYLTPATFDIRYPETIPTFP